MMLLKDDDDDDDYTGLLALHVFSGCFFFLLFGLLYCFVARFLFGFEIVQINIFFFLEEKSINDREDAFLQGPSAVL